jgi:hypothetical protein
VSFGEPLLAQPSITTHWRLVALKEMWICDFLCWDYEHFLSVVRPKPVVISKNHSFIGWFNNWAINYVFPQ